MKLFRLVAAAATAIACLVSCDTEGGLGSLRDRVDALEKANIPTMVEQVTAMQTSMSTLLTTQSTLLEYIRDVQNRVDKLGEGVTPDLEEVYAQLEKLGSNYDSFSNSLKTVQDYIDNNAAGKDWVSSTFATLETYNALQETLSKVKNDVEKISGTLKDLDSTIADKVKEAVSQSESSIKNWVNEKLQGYYTIAEIDAKLDALKSSTGDNGSSTADVEELSQMIQKAKEDITKAYKEAIEEAINTNNGVIDGKIDDKLSKAKEEIDSTISEIKLQIKGIEDRLAEAEGKIKSLLSRIQSVTVIPEYNDGSVGITSSTKDIRFEVYPLEAAEALAEAGSSLLSVNAVYTKTKAVEAGDFVTLAVTGCSYEEGVFSVSVNGYKLDDAFYEGTLGASARLLVSFAGTTVSSSYFQLTPEE